MPGWYPDPEAPERQRFWDGTQWTEARAYPANTVGADGQELPPPGEDEKKSPWPWIALVALIAAVLLGGAYVVTRSGNSEQPLPIPSIPVPTITLPTLPAPPTPPTPTVTETKTEKPDPPAPTQAPASP